ASAARERPSPPQNVTARFEKHQPPPCLFDGFLFPYMHALLSSPASEPLSKPRARAPTPFTILIARQNHSQPPSEIPVRFNPSLITTPALSRARCVSGLPADR